MTEPANRAWTMAARPIGAPKTSDFRLVESAVPTPGPGQVLIETHYHSIDPYMRGRMRAGPSYAAALEVGDVMGADAVGEVVASNSARFAVGDFAMGKIGWQAYSVSDARDVRQIDPDLAPIATSLGVLGMPGLAAYFGFFDVGRPKAGDVVVVTAASGAVGAVVGQLAKRAGCYVVGVAGSQQKIDYVLGTLGFDAAIDYKREDVAARMAELCPAGIDIYFDNVGGQITDAAIDNIALRGRAVICGQIDQYNATSRPQGPRNFATLIGKRARVEGFLVSDYRDRHPLALTRMAAWLNDGSLRYKEDVVDGLEHAPAAFIGLLEGKNFGKLVIKVR
jgi:NADPH-dependent curcumin reductase CurA